MSDSSLAKLINLDIELTLIINWVKVEELKVDISKHSTSGSSSPRRAE